MWVVHATLPCIKNNSAALKYSTRHLPENVAFADWGTKPAISQLNDFDQEIGMDTPAEFRKHAADCETMAKVSRDPETKAAWKRMAERWLVCAKWAEDQDFARTPRRIAKRRTHKAARGNSGGLFHATLRLYSTSLGLHRLSTAGTPGQQARLPSKARGPIFGEAAS